MEFSNRPKLFKGALFVYRSQPLEVSTTDIVFQYNPPYQLSRAIEKRAVESKKGSSGGAKEDLLRI
jgi:hypothetical protein